MFTWHPMVIRITTRRARLFECHWRCDTRAYVELLTYSRQTVTMQNNMILFVYWCNLKVTSQVFIKFKRKFPKMHLKCRSKSFVHSLMCMDLQPVWPYGAMYGWVTWETPYFPGVQSAGRKWLYGGVSMCLSALYGGISDSVRRSRPELQWT